MLNTEERMKKTINSNIISAILLLFLATSLSLAQTPPNVTKQEDAAAIDRIIDFAIQQEKVLSNDIRNYSPLVETYIQTLTKDKALGAVPTKDKYFLGKLDMREGVNERSLKPAPGFASTFKESLTQVYSVRFQP